MKPVIRTKGKKPVGRRALSLLLTVLFCLCAVPAAAAEGPALSARAAALYEPESGRFLVEKNAGLALPMASTTKVMTALVVLDLLPPGAEARADADTVQTEGSSLYLREGDVLSREDLLYALLLRSANDAAETLAKAAGGSVPNFVMAMNHKAAALGLSGTHFENPHGLSAEGHRTTARDLAVLTAAACEDEDFLRISGTKEYTVRLDGRSQVLKNHNRLLFTDPSVIAGKTGYTRASGRCLVSAAERDGVRLIAVTLDAPDDWRDHEALYDYGFSLLRRAELPLDGEYRVPVTGGAEPFVRCRAAEGYSAVVEAGDELSFEPLFPSFLYAPVGEGEIVGVVTVQKNGKTAAVIPLEAMSRVEEKEGKRSFFSRFFGLF